MECRVTVVVPLNVSIMFDIEQDMITEVDGTFSYTGRDFDYSSLDGLALDRHQRNLTIERYVSRSYQMRPYISIARRISDARMLEVRERMPGMALRWRMSPADRAEYNFKTANLQFTKLTNIVHIVNSTELLWRIVREMRREWMDSQEVRSAGNICTEDSVQNSTMIEEKIDSIEDRLGLNISGNEVMNVSDVNLKISAEMYIYLVFCPYEEDRIEWVHTFPHLVKVYSLKSILMAISSFINTLNNKEEMGWQYKLSLRVFHEVCSVVGLRCFELFNLFVSEEDMNRYDTLRHYLGTNKHHIYKLSDDSNVRTILNHPVHLLDRSGRLSPSAFIPFCEFGGDSTVMGEMTEEFDIPVCMRFRETLHQGQLCYQVDLNTFRIDGRFSPPQLQLGLTLILDYNEDRQIVGLNLDKKSISGGKKSISENIYSSISDSHKLAMVYIGSTTPIELYGDGQFELGNLKEIRVTESFLQLDSKVIRCEDSDGLEDCNSRHYLESLIDQCHCLPVSIKSFSQSDRKVPVCTSTQLDCAKEVQLSHPECLTPCNGLSITSVRKNSSTLTETLQSKFPNLVDQYYQYKSLNELEYRFMYLNFPLHIADLMYKPQLHVVRIYLDTPTFDLIERDKRAKLEDQISTIGGNMGLLTGDFIFHINDQALLHVLGFSLISAVEILYFAAKILLGVWVPARQR